MSRLTSISAGTIVRRILMDNGIADKVTKIYPIASDKADLPYIIYRRTSVVTERAKWEVVEDKAIIRIAVLTEDYDSGTELAEEVRAALDGKDLTAYGVSSCALTNTDETWMDDAFIQNLYFQLII